MSNSSGIVYLVGAGPGDPGLITVTGLGLLRRADVVVYDRLISRALLAVVKPNAELINVGKTPGHTKVTQEEINDILVERGSRGLTVVRLKGGDPFVFGRGFEELTACRKAGVPCYVVPGVSSAFAAPAAAGIAVTQREKVRSVAVVTGSTLGEGTTAPLDFAALARIDTVVVLMGRANLKEIAQAMMGAGRNRHTPAACIEQATTDQQRVAAGTLETIADQVDQLGLGFPMLAVIGEVAQTALTDGSSLMTVVVSGEPTATRSTRDIEHSPLAGRRIVITRPRSRSRLLRRSLQAHGAVVIECPLIEIVYPVENAALDEALQRVDGYDWIVFTSAHGVSGFWRRMVKLGHDARYLARCWLAAVGNATAGALRRRGLSADLIPATNSAAALADELIERTSNASKRSDRMAPVGVLFPRGDLAASTLTDKLRAVGWIVDDPVAYQTKMITPSPIALQALRSGVDAVTLFSPSAVRSYHELQIGGPATIVACIGSTAQVAREHGMTIQIVPPSTDVHSIVEAMWRWFIQRA